MKFSLVIYPHRKAGTKKVRGKYSGTWWTSGGTTLPYRLTTLQQALSKMTIPMK